MSRLSLSLLVLCWGVSAACAAEPVLVQGAGVEVSTRDVQAEVLRMAPEARKSILARPESLTQMGTTLYMRRALAAEAERQNLVADPLVAAAVQVARDRVLADAYLASLEAASRPTDAALDAQAMSQYKANPKQFTVPEQVHARHVLVEKGPDARATAEKLLGQLQGGADFAALAQAHSADTGSASKGGDLGYFPRGRMVPPFDEAVFALQSVGDLSGLVESEFGFHIIQLQGKRAAGLLPFDEVREGLRRDILTKQAAAVRLRAQNKVMEPARTDKAVAEAFAATQR